MPVKDQIKNNLRNQIFKISSTFGVYLKYYGVVSRIYEELTDEEISKLTPNQNYIYAKALLHRRRYDDALNEINKSITRSKRHIFKKILLRSEIYINSNFLGKAEQDLLHVINNNPSSGLGYYLLGKLNALRGSWFFAKGALETSLNLGYKSVELSILLGEVNFALKHYEVAAKFFLEATQKLQEITKDSERISYASYMTGLAYEKHNNHVEAKKYYRLAIKLDEVNEAGVIGIGALHEKYSQEDLAIDAYIKTNNANAYDKLGQLYARQGNHISAIKYFDKSIALDNVDSQTFFMAACSYEALNDLDKAAEYFYDASVRANNLNQQIYLKLFSLYTRLSDDKAAKIKNDIQLISNFYAFKLKAVDKKLKAREKYSFFFEHNIIDRQVILFESMTGGRVSGNPLAIFEKLLKDAKFRNFTFIWAVNKKDIIPNEFRSLNNVIFVNRNSDAYLKYLTQAGFLVNDSAFPTYFILKPEQQYLNTWHGTPWKTLGYDFATAKMDFANAARNFLQATHLIVPNAFTYNNQLISHQVAKISSAEIAITGYPRIDLTIETLQKPSSLLNSLGLNRNKKIILYAPTWRGKKGARSIEVDRIKHDLEQLSLLGAQVIFRGHYLVDSLLQDLKIKNVVTVPGSVDMNKLLGLTDILITDYSSVFFDYLVTNKPIVHYLHDYEEYVAERGLYFPIDDLPGDVATSRQQLIVSLKKLLVSEYVPTDKYRRSQELFVYMDDGDVTAKVIDWFLKGEKKFDLLPSNGKKNVLFHAGSLLQNGITAMLKSTVKAIDKKEYNVVITVRDSVADYPDRLRHLDEISSMVEIIPITGPMNELTANVELSYHNEFKRIFGNTKFHSVIDFSGNSPYFSKLFSFGPGLGTHKAIYLHNDLYSESKVRLPMLSEVFDQYKLFDKALSVSEPTHILNKNNLTKYFGVNEEVFDFVNNIQDDERILNKAKEPIPNRDLRIFKNGPVFIAMGRLSPEKDHAKLIRAFYELHKKNKDIQLIILGEGPLKHSLTNLISQLHLKKSVHLLGTRFNPYPYIKESDCFILPSNYEGQPTVLFEAMILGKPIISTDIISSRGVIEKGYGVLCLNSEEGLTEAMQDYLDGKISGGTFESQEYNEEALEMFYQKALNSNKNIDRF